MTVSGGTIGVTVAGDVHGSVTFHSPRILGLWQHLLLWGVIGLSLLGVEIIFLVSVVSHLEQALSLLHTPANTESTTTQVAPAPGNTTIEMLGMLPAVSPTSIMLPTVVPTAIPPSTIAYTPVEIAPESAPPPVANDAVSDDPLAPAIVPEPDNTTHAEPALVLAPVVLQIVSSPLMDSPIEETPIHDNPPIEDVPIQDNLPIEDAPIQDNPPVEDAPPENSPCQVDIIFHTTAGRGDTFAVAFPIEGYTATIVVSDDGVIEQIWVGVGDGMPSLYDVIVVHRGITLTYGLLPFYPHWDQSPDPEGMKPISGMLGTQLPYPIAVQAGETLTITLRGEGPLQQYEDQTLPVTLLGKSACRWESPEPPALPEVRVESAKLKPPAPAYRARG